MDTLTVSLKRTKTRNSRKLLIKCNLTFILPVNTNMNEQKTTIMEIVNYTRTEFDYDVTYDNGSKNVDVKISMDQVVKVFKEWDLEFTKYDSIDEVCEYNVIDLEDVFVDVLRG